MSERINTLQNRLESARNHLNTILDQVGDRWDDKVYSDGLGWTVRQLVNHLADADRGHNAQAMNIAAGKDIIPPDFDIERYNRRTTEKTAEKTPEQARAELAESRAELYAWLAEQDEAALDKTGRHASLRIMSAEEILYFLAEHERGHADDIADALGISV